MLIALGQAGSHIWISAGQSLDEDEGLMIKLNTRYRRLASVSGQAKIVCNKRSRKIIKVIVSDAHFI
jgi:hypothetical protein